MTTVQIVEKILHCYRSSQQTSPEAQRQTSKSCYQLAVFREPEAPSVRTLINCEGGQRLSHAYLSESSVVDVEFFVSRNQLKNQLYFLLHYTGESMPDSLPRVCVCCGAGGARCLYWRYCYRWDWRLRLLRSRSRTSPHGSSPVPDDVITSHVCCVSCTGFLSCDESTTRSHAWCTSRCLVWHWHIWLMTSTLSLTAAAAFSDQQLTGHQLSGQFRRQLKTFLFVINWPQSIVIVWLFAP